MHQQQQQQQHYQLRKNETENCVPSPMSISLASSILPSSSLLSPNTSTMHHHVSEKHEKTHQPLPMKHETSVAPFSVENGSRNINNSDNRFNKAENYHQFSGKTVREELEASRSKIPKLGKLEKIFSLQL